MDSGSILKLLLTEFPDGLDMWRKKKELPRIILVTGFRERGREGEREGGEIVVSVKEATVRRIAYEINYSLFPPQF